VGSVLLTKVLLDGESRLNILNYIMLDAIALGRDRLRPTGGPFHRVVLGRWATLFGQINLPVTFGTPTNIRTETLIFEVVGF
jgi:hypothetical protein